MSGAAHGHNQCDGLTVEITHVLSYSIRRLSRLHRMRCVDTMCEFVYTPSALCHPLIYPYRHSTFYALSIITSPPIFFFFFLNDPPPPEISPLPLHAPFPIPAGERPAQRDRLAAEPEPGHHRQPAQRVRVRADELRQPHLGAVPGGAHRAAEGDRHA